MGFISFKYFEGGKRVITQALRVDSSYRGQGLGRSILELSKREVLLKGRLKVSSALVTYGIAEAIGSFGKLRHVDKYRNVKEEH